ncbi:Centrosomal protein [Phytophthora citrophthora]|uniref:Centrosomal protein n=1 Tax=Phytophthora citrophthora TaxID=4793 RepID=A0AAD9LSN7_9STRA|nr:Centrosomal protein [Phytophthora citrophthora]
MSEGSDAYGSDDYEAESPRRPEPSPSRSQDSEDASPMVEQQRFDPDLIADEESESGAVAPLPKEKSKRSQESRENDTISGRHLMDNTPWTYIVSALQVRMLRIPVADSRTIRELRVFATIDKQAAQSRGSRWKQERQPGEGSPLRSNRKRSNRSRSPRRIQPYRRSGLIEEVKWVRGDGKLQWTFSMEKFRRLKAYTPRVKAFVYGIGDTQLEDRARSQMENLTRQEKEGTILSFGWFFLDLRTPDLPERWLKLQNSPFGGEILITSSFSPVEVLSAQLNKRTTTQIEDGGSTNVRGERSTKRNAVPVVVSGESGDYLQIGDGQDILVLSIFIESAFNLLQVVEESMGKIHPDTDKIGFWLSYSLFDVVVQTDVFYNLITAEFSPIRDSFRVKSSVKELAICLDTLGSITMYMCTENRVLAGVEIPLRPLLLKGIFSVSSHQSKPAKTSAIDGTFSFPDFDDSVISISISVELVEARISKTNEIQGKEQVIKVESLDPEPVEQNELAMPTPITESTTEDQVVFKLDHLRLKISAIAPFTGEENLSVELVVGDETVSDVLVFCSYTNQHAFATCSSLGILFENLSRQSAVNKRVWIRCLSSVSNHLLAVSSEAAKVIQDEEGFPKTIVIPLLNESKQSVGQCLLSCVRGLEARQKLGRELLSDANGEKHHYRLCIKLKSVRDIELSGGYSLRYQNPFLDSASGKVITAIEVISDWFTVKDKRETETLNFYCVFDIFKDLLDLKQEMQEFISIDLISSDEERVGSAVFSLNYLYFSEEQFCCSEDNCQEMFMTQSEAEAHWLEVHMDSNLPDAQAGPEAYSHSYRCCAINIPLVSTDASKDPESQRRVGSVRVSAYLEDMGALTDKQKAAMGTVLSLPPPPPQDNHTKMRSSSPLNVREAEETSREPADMKNTINVEVPASKTHPIVETQKIDYAKEREKETAKIQEALEREKSVWKQEQHLQQLQWKRRFAEMEKARMDELEEEWARREEERSNLLKSAQEEYQRLEQTLRKSLADLETRERRLAIAETALHREQEAKRDENEHLQRRLKSEQNHVQSLVKKQTEAYDRRIALLETQLSDAEKRAKQVEADFVEYRQQQRKLPESKLREEIAALKGRVAELEKQKMAKERDCERAEANVEKMKAQLEHMASLLSQEKKKHEAQVVDELEKLRVKYIAREEKYVLDGDRDELRAIKKQLDNLKGFKLMGDTAVLRSSRQRSHESISPQQHRNLWHTQSRQTAFVHTRSASQQYEYQESSTHSDHAAEDVSDWESSSYVETRSQKAPQLSLQSEQRSRAGKIKREHPAAPVHEDDQDDGLGESEKSSVGPDTELGRLFREKKLLLASGAYDGNSYLVRELDRLISVTRANVEHQKAVA